MKAKRFAIPFATTILLVGCGQFTQTEDPPASPKPVTETIRATLADAKENKTVLNEDGSVYWTPNNAIAVFFNSFKTLFVSYNSENAPIAYFVGDVTATGYNEGASENIPGKYTYWGLFPYHPLVPNVWGDIRISSDYMDWEGKDFYMEHCPTLSGLTRPENGSCDGTMITTTSPDWQRGFPGTFDKNLNIAIALTEDYHNLQFYNVLGGIRFSLHKTDVWEVVFRSNSEEPLAGIFSTTMGADGVPQITDVKEGKNVVTLLPADGEAFLPDTWYYIMLFPGQLAGGYTLELHADDGDWLKTETSEVEIKRSVFGSLAYVDDSAEKQEVIIPVESISLNVSTLAVSVLDDEVQLLATVLPEDASDKTVTWTSSDPSVVVVSDKGFVAGLKRGTAVITAQAGDKTAQCTVTVSSSEYGGHEGTSTETWD